MSTGAPLRGTFASAKPNIKQPQAAVQAPSNPIPVSDLRIFITNLRLLDFDLHEDWPEITAQTFSAKNADQRQRIGGTEWALFRLFEVWDKAETTQKLQPFFPPLEPLQSLNLRAALYRSLNELKKNGALGREFVLRKTMLDECKGEKFYEILALFSTAVLKKVISSQEGQRTVLPIARRLATATKLVPAEQQSLLPLAIAHKATLRNILRRKEEKRQRQIDFEKLLSVKANEINARIRKNIATPRSNSATVPQRDIDAVKKQLHDNWVGDPKWLDVILLGDGIKLEDAFLTRPFEKVRRVVEAGRALESALPEVGLLENLQLRVDEQQTRLSEWRAFHEKLRSEETKVASHVSKPAATKNSFAFDNHLKYALPHSSERSQSTIPTRKLRPDYRSILSDMFVELSLVTTTQHASSALSDLSRAKRQDPDPPSQQPSIKEARIPHKSILESQGIRSTGPQNSFAKIPVLRPSRQLPPATTPFNSDTTLVEQASTVHRSGRVASRMESPFLEDNEETTDPDHPPALEPDARVRSSSSASPATVHSSSHERSSPPPDPSCAFPSESPVPVIELLHPAEPNPEEVLAEQIINAYGEATPSPVKKPQPRMSLSLMERTRMSMARQNSFEPIPESPPFPSPSLPALPTVEPDEDRRATLLERTRLSMAAMQSRPRVSLGPRAQKEKRKSRNSIFPVNQFDTPRARKSFERIEEIKSAQRTPKEDLFSDEIDYNRVFKSRPRVATSPIFSPPQRNGEDSVVGEDYEEEVTGIDLAGVDDEEDEDGFTGTWAESPSRRAGILRS